MSPDSRSTISTAKTLCFLREGFEFETLEKTGDYAAAIKFPFDNPHYNAGDVLVIMDGEEIIFHGMIVQVDEGFAYASDKRDSKLPPFSA